MWTAAVAMAVLAIAAVASAQSGGGPSARPAASGPSASFGSGGGSRDGGNGSSGSADAIIHHVRVSNDQIELSVNSSRILTLDQRIPWAQVNNPDLLELHPLSPNEIQVFAKAPGVTQINLRTEDQKLYTIDATVLADSQALSAALKMLFPHSSVRVVPLTTGVILTGYVDQADHVKQIVEIAQEYYPHVINTMQVAGAQQVLLHVKVMEVSRTKMRQLGFDFSKTFNAGNSMLYSGAAGLLSYPGSPPVLTAAGQNVFASVLDSTGTLTAVLEAMRQDNLAKLLAEPTLVTVSGRPAQFLSGGQVPVLVPESLGTVSIDYKDYGTQIDFVPVVLGNGRIHLDVRPQVSELDPTHSVTIGSTTVPGMLMRKVETGVEMNAGQTLAIAGLVQSRVEAQVAGLPLLSELPIVGMAFRNVQEQYNEIELLILVTPELAEAVNACDMPPGGPGFGTTSPSDWELYGKGLMEVPVCEPGKNGAAPGPQWSMPVSTEPPSAGTVLPAGSATGTGRGMGSGNAMGSGGATVIPEPIDAPPAPMPTDTPSRRPTPAGVMTAPNGIGPSNGVGPATAPAPLPPERPSQGSRPSAYVQPSPLMADSPAYGPRQPMAPTTANNMNMPAGAGGEPAFLGPVGYDMK